MTVPYSADWVREQAAGKTRLESRDCSICGYPLAYIFKNGEVFYDPGCNCSRIAPGALEPRSFESIADWLAMQKSDEARDSIMKGLS